MKATTTIYVLIFLMHTGLLAQTRDSVVEVETIDEFGNLYRYEHYYISGQPSLDALKWLQSQGGTRVINLSSESENEDFTYSSFNESAVVAELGMEYHAIPVSGRSGYTPENLTRMGELVGEGEKVLIHCSGAGRATSFFMGYLVLFKGYTLDEAVDVGQELTYFLSLEHLLDIEITMQAR